MTLTNGDARRAQALPPATLDSIRLKWFKAAYKPEPVKVSPFTVLIGRNGSGKSTLLEALQWLDKTLRRDAVEACKRTFGVHDLINLRSDAERPRFELELVWRVLKRRWHYRVRVEEDVDESTPVIRGERLWARSKSGVEALITEPESTDRLALWRATDERVAAIREFWNRAVFLRLSPAKLAEGSLPRRTTADPLLDEEGQNLPALLNELDDLDREALVEMVRFVLPDMRDVTVSKPSAGRSERVHYSLHEKMPYRGRSGRTQFPIPAWMLSEGTRRLTAIFALLCHNPPPSILCIEEVENGLDPWAVITLLQHLKSAADRGTQIFLTTHSPWLLDHVPLDSIIQVRRVEGDTSYERFADRDAIRAFANQVPAGTRYVREGV